MIPKIIWQTYETPFNELPQYVKDCSQTWIDQNPEWEYRYMDANQRKDFVLEYFGKEWFDIFNKLPYGVMRADIWRHMILFIYGGVYCDLDTICKAPIEIWLKNDKKTIFFMDNDLTNLCQFVFASAPKQKVIQDTINYIKNKITDKQYMKTIFESNLVPQIEENTTGANICTEAIKLSLKLEGHLLENYEQKNKFSDFYYYGDVSYKMIHDYPIEHLVGSLNWNEENYIKWQYEKLVEYDS